MACPAITRSDQHDQTNTGSATYTAEADAFGQVISQQAAGARPTTPTALGRALQPGFVYTGLGNTLAHDAAATYIRGPAGDLLAVGPGEGGGSLYAWTDQHMDIVGQFSATGTSLARSATYDPTG